MSDQLLSTARREEARLQAELESIPTFQKLKAVQCLIALYSGDAAKLGTTGDVRPGRAISRPGTQSASVISAAEDFLRSKGGRAQTNEIFEALTARGLSFSSANPIASLSSALSHSALFNNKRGEGYGLSEWPTDASPESEEHAPVSATKAQPISVRQQTDSEHKWSNGMS